MADPQDRRMADLFEMELRRKAELDPGNEWELVWFLRLPLETRCSYMRILEARIDQDSKRQSLFRQSCYHQRSWRHPTTACMHLDVAQAPSYPWNSLNRRRRRRPAQYRRRKRRPLQPGSSQHNAPPPETRPTPMVFDPVPTRPPTPEGLRLAIHEHTDISLQAQGYDPFTGDKLCSYTPRILAVPPEPVHYPPFTLYPPINPVFVDGDYIDPILAYLVAAGHYHRTPWERYTFQNAAEEIFDTDREMPGLLDRLIDALFPGGLSDVRTRLQNRIFPLRTEPVVSARLRSQGAHEYATRAHESHKRPIGAHGAHENRCGAHEAHEKTEWLMILMSSPRYLFEAHMLMTCA